MNNIRTFNNIIHEPGYISSSNNNNKSYNYDMCTTAGFVPLVLENTDNFIPVILFSDTFIVVDLKPYNLVVQKISITVHNFLSNTHTDTCTLQSSLTL